MPQARVDSATMRAAASWTSRVRSSGMATRSTASPWISRWMNRPSAPATA
ncbi:hypothetical protein ABZ281_29055 [Streptomyces sp. NPDC006265]